MKIKNEEHCGVNNACERERGDTILTTISLNLPLICSINNSSIYSNNNLKFTYKDFHVSVDSVRLDNVHE